jgi:hypothetical protein
MHTTEYKSCACNEKGGGGVQGSGGGKVTRSVSDCALGSGMPLGERGKEGKVEGEGGRGRERER